MVDRKQPKCKPQTWALAFCLVFRRYRISPCLDVWTLPNCHSIRCKISFAAWWFIVCAHEFSLAERNFEEKSPFVQANYRSIRHKISCELSSKLSLKNHKHKERNSRISLPLLLHNTVSQRNTWHSSLVLYRSFLVPIKLSFVSAAISPLSKVAAQAFVLFCFHFSFWILPKEKRGPNLSHI